MDDDASHMKIEDAVRNTLGALLGEGEDVVKAEVVASPEDPSAEAAARLAGTHDPGAVKVDVTLKLAKPVEFISMTLIVDPKQGEEPK